MNEEGSAVIWMLGLIVASSVVMFALANIGNAALIRAKMQTAADAASLSAAYEVAHYSQNKACSAARKAAQSNEAKVVSCEVNDNEVEITVRHESSGIEAQARAEID